MSKLLRSTIPLLISLVIAGAAMPAVAAAAPIASQISVSASDSLALTASERDQIVQQLKSTVNFYRNKSAWKCVSEPIGASPSSGDEDTLPPLGSYVDIAVQITPVSGGENDGDVNIAVTISLNGKQLSTGTASIAQRGIGDDRGRVLSGKSGAALESAMDHSAPCTPKVRLKTRTRADASGVTVSYSEDGEVQLAMQEDGSFTNSIPTAYQWSIAMSGPVKCAIDPDSGSRTIDVAGSFDSNAGSLDFTHFADLSPASTNGATCTAPNGTVSVPGLGNVGGAGSVAFADGSEVQVPFEDGGEAVLPVSGMMATLDLVFENDAENVPVATQAFAN